VDRSVLLAIVVVFMLALLGLMAWGWYGRRKRQAHIPAPLAVPADPGAIIASLEGKYVATTASGDRLDRVAVHGLGFRGTATVTVTESGVVVALHGREVWIPRDHLAGSHRATWTIDRVVEPGGLEVIAWRLGDVPVESAFRMPTAGALDSAVTRLLERRAA
jgi:hypothetical protein